MGVVENLKDIAELAQKVGQIDLYKRILVAEDEVRELTREKRRLEDRAEELERKLKFKAAMTFRDPVYYQEGDETPFCTTCYDKDKVAVHLAKDGVGEWSCNVCKAFYDTAS